MSASNSVHLIGNLIADAELKYTAGGMAIANFTLANNYRKREGDAWVDDVSFFDVSLFGKRAESVHPYLGKGQPVAIDGEVRQDRWEKDGQKHSRIRILANDLKLLNKGQGGGQRAESNQGTGTYQAPAAGTTAHPPAASTTYARPATGTANNRPVNQPPARQAPAQQAFDDDFPDDIPF